MAESIFIPIFLPIPSNQHKTRYHIFRLNNKTKTIKQKFLPSRFSSTERTLDLSENTLKNPAYHPSTEATWKFHFLQDQHWENSSIVTGKILKWPTHSVSQRTTCTKSDSKHPKNGFHKRLAIPFYIRLLFYVFVVLRRVF